jgi:hypothetical protein
MKNAGAYAAECFFVPAELPGTVHSVYAGAVNFLFRLPGGEDRMFTLLPPGSPLLPDCAAAPASRLPAPRPREGAPCRVSDGCLFAEGMPPLRLLRQKEPQLVCRGKVPSAHFLQAVSSLPEGMPQSAVPLLPEKYRASLEKFCEALLYSESEAARTAFLQALGAGIGLTPSCDDAFIGMLAMRRACCPTAENSGNTCEDILLGELLSGGRRTTRVSEKYLKCACRGMFSSALAQLVQSCGGEENPPAEALSEVLRTGHTSGADTLYGVRLFARKARSGKKSWSPGC